MCVNTQTGVSMMDIAMFASRISYQFTGVENPVRVYYDDLTDIYHIVLYTNAQIGWLLGVTIISRLLPIHIKYVFDVSLYQTFLTEYNIAQVGLNQFIDPSVKYDAYSVVNNNNKFNTRGYYRV